MPETPTVHIPVGPPPAPIALRVVSVTLAILAAALGFLGFCFYAGLAAAGSALFGILEIVRSRRVVEIPRSEYLGRSEGSQGKAPS